MTDKKPNLSVLETFKSNPRQPYSDRSDIRTDLGYSKPDGHSQSKPKPKWAYEVLNGTNRRAAQESPIKIWWLAQKQLEVK